MIISNIITGLVNFFSFLSLSVTTSSVNSFLGATFILAASLFLEAYSLQNDSRHIKSLLIPMCIGSLYFISIAAIVISIAGLTRFVNIYFEKTQSIHIMISSFTYSIYHISPTDVNAWVLCFGIVATVIPFGLAIREIILRKFRDSYYNLAHGLYGK